MLISGVFSLTRQAIQLGFWPHRSLRKRWINPNMRMLLPSCEKRHK
jgi:K+ transporter